jgi:AraC-like DNA-binding protein
MKSAEVRSAPPTPHLAFDTRMIARAERVDAYRELLFGLDVEVEPQAFAANLQIYELGELAMVHTRIGGEGQVVHRTPERIRRDGQESLLLHLTLTGGERGLAGDRSMSLSRGSLAVSDLTRPFSYAMPECEVFTLVASRTAVEQRLGTPADGLHGLVLDPVRAALLADHLSWLAARLPRGAPETAAALGGGVIDLFATAARPSAATLERTRESVARAAFARACRFIDVNYAAPDLTPDRIARAAGLSRSALYRLFEPWGGVAAQVQRRRLEAARAALLDPHDGRLIGTVAYDCGFASQPLFSRSFREAFGCTPRELRGSAANDDAATAALAVGRAQFRSWMERLG